jgi:hypothetical protein
MIDQKASIGEVTESIFRAGTKRPRDELLRRNGIYAELEHLQFGEEDPAKRLVS